MSAVRSGHMAICRNQPRFSRGDLRQIGQVGDTAAGQADELVAAIAHGLPVVVGLELDRGRHREIGGRIAGALPLLPSTKLRWAGVGRPAQPQETTGSTSA